MASRRIGAGTVSFKSVNFPGHAPDRQSSDLRIMNRIRVGTVDDIDNTHVELKAKKFGCLAPIIKADDPVRLKTLDIRTLIGPGSPVAVFVPQPQIRSRSLAGAILGGNEGLNIDRLQDWALRRGSSNVCVIGALVFPLQEEDHTWTLRLTGDLRDTRRTPYEAATAGSGR